MPRARNVKPSLFKNELLGESDPILTVLFVGLWTLADREGRLEDRPKRIKAEIFPYRELPDFNGYLTELAQLGFIDRYEVGGEAIIQVLNFTKHQSPHKTEKASELPEKPEETDSCESTVKAPLKHETVHVKESLIPDSSNTDSSNTERGRARPKDSDDVLIFMMEITDQRTARTECERFFDYYTANGWKVGKNPMRDWQATARNWIRRRDDENSKPTFGGRESKSERSDRAARDYLASLGEDDGGGVAWAEGDGTGTH